MNPSPKIIVLKMREIIYTILLLFLVVMLIVCLALMFSPKKTSRDKTVQNSTLQQEEQAQEEPNPDAPSLQEEKLSAYTAGVYTVPVSLGGSETQIEVTVDPDHINSIRLVNLSETTAAAFPLVSPALDHIVSQILNTQQLENITCSSENRYTSQMLLSAISDALELARNS